MNKVANDGKGVEIGEFLRPRGWNIVSTLLWPERKAETTGFSDLGLKPQVNNCLSKLCPSGIYLHQRESIIKLLEGKNVCLTTGTASGKSLPFYVCAIEHLLRNPNSRIIAIYPLKALGREQEERWRTAIAAAGIQANVGRIDGQVPVQSRIAILRDAHVLIMTPDIIHAWLLSNLSSTPVVNLLRKLSVIVVDEVHSYTGVFGSNAAFLFRHLQHALSLLGASPQYVCASATIAEPTTHLNKLFGIDFYVISPEKDTSPRHEVEIHLIKPPNHSDILSEISDLLGYLTTRKESRFLAFVDSRKQTELIASIVARSKETDGEGGEDDDRHGEHLTELDVLPYRAGYEEYDRDLIQDRLSKGLLGGVVSTSALELGIDIRTVDTGVLIGVPHNKTSLLQRIGRIGRHRPGQILVVNTGDVHDEAVFRKPAEFMERPLAESALYLENVRIQYIHALCLARLGGEHDQVCEATRFSEATPFSTSSVSWPEGFLALCEAEKRGEIPVDLQAMKSQAGDDPNHTFPLRDVETQFRVVLQQGSQQTPRGSLSYQQVLREAYPGAVYYYTTIPYRVCRVYQHSKAIHVRREKKYTTSPIALPTLVFPNLSEGNIYQSRRHEDIKICECNLQIREAISGFKERRGPNEIVCSYPLDSSKSGIYFDLPRFTRNDFTTGVVITHPSLGKDGVRCDALGELLYEAFLMAIPFERRDINFASDRFRASRGDIREGERFIAIYDQTYGSLRMSETVTQQATIHYDAESDILYILVREGEEEEYIEIADNITLELDENGQVIGIEIEDASKILKAVPELLNAIHN